MRSKAPETYAELCLQRAEQATPAPWVGDAFEMVAPKAPVLIPGNKQLVWAHDYHINEWDAEFCRHARTDVPELAKRLKRACEALRKLGATTEYTYDWKTGVELADELEAIPEGN